ncbi:MAG: fibronectin type III domain-containing protein, partial [Planctomycetaceae bacterium]
MVRVLRAGVDYLFRYLQNSNRVIFVSIASYPLGTYTIEALSRASTPTLGGLLVDMANNTLLPNKFDGATTFQVALADIPSAPLLPVGSRGDAQVTLAWNVPASIGGTPIVDYLVEYSDDGGTTWTLFDDGVSSVAGTVVTGLVNGTTYVFRVQARNAVNILSADPDDGNWSEVSLPVKPLAPAGKPTSLVANGGDASATLSWTAPVETGGAPITDYRIQYSTNGGTTWTTFPHAPSTATTITVTGLANGVEHVFRVAAVTEYGPGLSSDVSIVVVPMTFPDAPTGLTATLGNTIVDLAWTSNFNGGSTVVNHVIQFRVTGNATWQTFTPPAPVTGSSVRVTGLVNGTSYEFRVAATNAVGDSGFSNVAGPVTPVAPASAPLALAAVGGNAQATLSWTVPADNGGSAITDYRIERSTNGGTTWTLVADGVSTATTATLLGLVNGTTYVFRVAAITSFGVGAWSTTSGPVTPMTVATAPSALSGVRGDSKVDLAWTAPANNGGSTITDYTIEYRPSAGGAWVAFPHAASAATAASVTGLVNGTSYEFRVSAVNAAGTSAPSNVAGPLVPMTFASVPLNLVGAFGDRKVTLTWATPTSNGGGAISDYLVEYLPSGPGAVWTTFPHDPSTATRIVVTDLVNGVGYTFRVSAVNPVGAGTAATVGPITPMTIPGAPSIATATPGDSKVDLVWRAPLSNGGGTITNYIIEYKVDVATAAWVRYPRAASAALSATVGQLVNGTRYVFRVTAVNPAGAGPASLASAPVMPVTVPDAPLAVTA